MLAAVIALFALAAAVLLTPSPALAEESCPNAQYRTGFSAGLPDCRAYELVSAAGTEPYFETFSAVGNINIESRTIGETKGAVASVTGERFAYYSTAAPPGSPSDGPYYLSSRTPTGWSTEDLIPPHSTTTSDLCNNAYTPAYSLDLSKAVLADGWGQEGPDCGRDEPLLLAGEPLGFQNLFLRDNETASYQLIDGTPSGVSPKDAWFQSASADLSHVVFTEDDEAPLTPEAPTGKDIQPEVPSGEDLYEWSRGVVRLVTILPDGTPVRGSLADAHEPLGTHALQPTFTHAVSADGSRVLFVAGGNLYERENAEQEQSPLDGKGSCADPAKACTVQVDASQAGGSGGGGTFRWASADGSKVFFTDGDSAGLTSDTVTGSGQNLYEYDVETGKLTDLTPAGDAGVQGVSGASEDGSYVYFVAEGVLATAANSAGESATAGQPNLYLGHGGARTFVATLEPSAAVGDGCDWTESCLTARVSPNGAFVGFNSIRPLTGYDNTDANTGNRRQEIFLYDAAQNKLSCVSCDPTGARPTAPAGIRLPEEDVLGTAHSTPGYLGRNVLDDGRVFFDTFQALLPNDGNGDSDVYEYQGGQLHLISSPTGGASYFYDSSASGNDVFIVTAQHLVARDTAAISLYDARVGGGFPEAARVTACGEEDCKGAVTAAPSFSAPTSATFSGAGNASPPPSTPVKPKTAAQIKADKLAKALKACRTKHNKRKRRVCESEARKKYGPTSKAKKSVKANRRGK